MKTTITEKNLDREIRKRVQALEQEIPQEVENSFLEKLDGIVPGLPQVHRSRFFYYGALATAASILLAILFLLLPSLHRPLPHAGSQDVWVQSAQVDGQPASTIIIASQDPDCTIIWLEKINKDKGGSQ